MLPSKEVTRWNILLKRENQEEVRSISLLMMEKGRSSTAPAETARVKVLKDSLQEKGHVNQGAGKTEGAQTGQALSRLFLLFNPKGIT